MPDAAVLLLPAGMVTLFIFLHRWLPGPTAGGLAFLFAAGVAYWLFPRARVSFSRLMLGGLFALLAAWALSVLLAQKG